MKILSGMPILKYEPDCSCADGTKTQSSVVVKKTPDQQKDTQVSITIVAD